jgi:hypothetical protein
VLTTVKWVRMAKRNNRIGCCDCGLVHRADFRIGKLGLEMRLSRSVRETARLRKEMKQS